jgi:hypothetical protein
MGKIRRGINLYVHKSSRAAFISDWLHVVFKSKSSPATRHEGA